MKKKKAEAFLAECVNDDDSIMYKKCALESEANEKQNVNEANSTVPQDRVLPDARNNGNPNLHEEIPNYIIGANPLECFNCKRRQITFSSHARLEDDKDYLIFFPIQKQEKTGVASSEISAYPEILRKESLCVQTAITIIQMLKQRLLTSKSMFGHHLCGTYS